VIEFNKLQNVSMDGPSVNWNMIRHSKWTKIKCEEDVEIMNVGGCRLHVMHGSGKHLCF